MSENGSKEAGLIATSMRSKLYTFYISCIEHSSKGMGLQSCGHCVFNPSLMTSLHLHTILPHFHADACYTTEMANTVFISKVSSGIWNKNWGAENIQWVKCICLVFFFLIDIWTGKFVPDLFINSPRKAKAKNNWLSRRLQIQWLKSLTVLSLSSSHRNTSVFLKRDDLLICGLTHFNRY